MGVGFLSLGEIVHCDQEISVSCTRGATCRTDVAMSAPCLDIVSCLKTVVLLPNFIQGLNDTQETSWRFIVLFGSTSSTLLRGRTIWATLDRPLSESHLRPSTPFLTASDFHWAQLFLFVELRSTMSFLSGCCPVSTSWRMGPMSVV
jgi:hypothetical protein